MTPPQPRRILMTADAVGGVWSYALTLATALDRRGIETVLAVMGPRPSAAQRRHAAEIQSLTLVESDFRLEWMNDPGRDLHRAGVWLLSLESRYEPDVVHINGYTHGAVPWSAPCLVVAHSCVASWWAAVRGGTPPTHWNDYAVRVRRGLAAAGLVIAPTAAFLTEIARRYGRRHSVRVIPNGCAPGLFAPDIKQPFILAAGRLWDEAKNIPTLDRIASRLPWPIYVAGDDASPDGRIIACSNLDRLGVLSRDDLAAVMRRATIFVAPARYEPFGLAILEAALSGCALVLSDLPTLRELWDGAAIFTQLDDDEAMAKTLESLCRDPDQVAVLRRRALVRARRFTAERMAEGYITAYRDLQMMTNRAAPLLRAPALP